MARQTAPQTTQDAPTQPPARDANGHELDRWNLPVAGPPRAAALAELGKPDPNEDPDAWSAADAKKADALDTSLTPDPDTLTETTDG